MTLDLREDFRRAVVAPFVAGYARGETPNPCVRCNGAFRFSRLLQFARHAGAETLVTGHYARVVEHRGRRLLARATDLRKDQSYMLARLDPSKLDRIAFPLGKQTKEETRSEAARAGLHVAARPESQEACFLAGDDYRAFLERRGLAASEGSIVDEDGRELGRHTGHWRFTPGQRRGLGVSSTLPLYTVRSDPRTNTVVVGPRQALACTSIDASGKLYVPIDRADVKLRYRSEPLAADVRATTRGFRLELDQPAYGVASGQAAVLYEDGVVVGAGLIRA